MKKNLIFNFILGIICVVLAFFIVEIHSETIQATQKTIVLENILLKTQQNQRKITNILVHQDEVNTTYGLTIEQLILRIHKRRTN